MAAVTGHVLSEKKEVQPPTPPPPGPNRRTRQSQSPPQKNAPAQNVTPETLVLPPDPNAVVTEQAYPTSSTVSKFDLPPLQWKTTKTNEGPSFLEPTLSPSKQITTENIPNPSHPVPVTGNGLGQTISTLDWVKYNLPQQLPSYNTKRDIEPFIADPSLTPTDKDITNIPPVLLSQEPVLAATFVPDFTFRPDAQQTFSFSNLEYSAGLSVGFAKGCWDSAGGFYNLAKELSLHPSGVIFGAITGIAELSKMIWSKEWEGLSQALVPELRQLVLDWDNLSDYERGEMLGHAVGNFGFDIIAPGALAKALAKGAKGAEVLKAAYQSLQSAKEVYLVEVLATAESYALGVAHKAETAVAISEKGGISVAETAQLKEGTGLVDAVAGASVEITNNPLLRESYEIFNKTQDFLKSYSKTFMPEIEVRKLIHQTGLPTFPKPKGIPENFKIRITTKGAGMEYTHPKNTHISVRVMPGKPHSPFPHSKNLM